MKKIFTWLVLLFFTYPVSADGINFTLPNGARMQQHQVLPGYSQFVPVTTDEVLLAGSLSSGGGGIVKRNLETGENSEAGNFTRQLQGLSYYENQILAAFPDRISRIAAGKVQDIITGLPTGDFGASRLEVKGGLIYFGQGTVTNSGIVGPDNVWLQKFPSLRDLPCRQVSLSGTSVETENFLTKKKNDKALTGSFMPFNAPAKAGDTRGFPKCSGAVYTSDLSGHNLQIYAWGFHAPSSVSVGDTGEVWVLDRGMENRGSRPVKEGADSIYKAERGAWHGWPDYQAGVRIDQSKVFAADPGPVQQPFLVTPPGKYFLFAVSPEKFFPGSGFAVGSRQIDLIDLKTKHVQTIAVLPEGSKITDAKFGPGGFYFLSEEGLSAAIYQIEPGEFKASGGGLRGRGTVWPWVLNSSLIAIGLFALLYIKRPPRTA